MEYAGFWECSLKELQLGFRQDKEKNSLVCLVCGKAFLAGQVFEHHGNWFDAKETVKRHVEEQHGGMFAVLRGMDKKYTGLTPQQNKILEFFHQGLSDEAVAKKAQISLSTVRQYRFSFREKAREARIFLTLWNLAGESKNQENGFVSFPNTALNPDERYAITAKEHEEALKKYFQKGVLKSFPKKEKLKLSILKEILSLFVPEKTYHEKEVNEILKAVFHDPVTLRRYLIDYGFLDRKEDGSAYWVKHL